MARIALIVGTLAAIVYPIPLQIQGTTYYQTVGFLVLLNAMLGVGWNVIGGWTGQFDFGPQVFFAVGAYAAALLYVKLGVDAWLGLPLAAGLAALICAVLTYPLTRLRGHYFAISTVAMIGSVLQLSSSACSGNTDSAQNAYSTPPAANTAAVMLRASTL